MLRDSLMSDLDNMEEAASRTVDRCDIWQDRIIYSISVAIIHIIQWILKDEKKKVVPMKRDTWICETCEYYPPSSGDGKPCCVCEPNEQLLSCYVKRREN